MIRSINKTDFPSIAEIYRDGMASGIATFETEVPSWEQWDSKFLHPCRFAILSENELAGWCALSPVSKREVYKGVAESTIYISHKFQRLGLGTSLLSHLVSKSELAGFYTLQASIFPQNKASIQLHLNCGFRTVGLREKIAQRDGKWHDNLLLERRAAIT